MSELGNYRSIARFGKNGEALITAPLATINKDVESYDIRMPKQGKIVGHISGAELYRIAQEQETRYIAQDPERRTRIRLVDVSDYIDVRDN